MSSAFFSRLRVDLGSDKWDALCIESPDAWLFHTSRWLAIQNVEDLSFAVADRGGKPLSLVVIGATRPPENNTGKDLRVYNFRAGIAHMDGLPVELQDELNRFILFEVRRTAMSKRALDRKSTRLNSSHSSISYAV